MLNFYVMDGKKLIDFKPKWINYVRALDRRCKMAGFWGNMTLYRNKNRWGVAGVYRRDCRLRLQK